MNSFWLKAEILYITTASFRMTHFPSSTHVINAVQENHGTALTCVCRCWRGARSFTFEDLCFPLWFSELLRIKDYKIFLVYCGFYCLHLLPWLIPVFEEMWLTVFEMIVHCQSPNISLVCLCLSLCLSPSHPAPAWNRRCLFPLDTLRDKLKCRKNGLRNDTEVSFVWLSYLVLRSACVWASGCKGGKLDTADAVSKWYPQCKKTALVSRISWLDLWTAWGIGGALFIFIFQYQPVSSKLLISAWAGTLVPFPQNRKLFLWFQLDFWNISQNNVVLHSHAHLKFIKIHCVIKESWL